MGQRHRDELAAIDTELETRVASYTSSVHDMSVSSSPPTRDSDVPLAAAATLMMEIGFEDDEKAVDDASSERESDSAAVTYIESNGGGGGVHRLKRRRSKLPLKAVLILREYFARHLNYPYPSDQDKKMLAGLTKLTGKQISHWFTNSRKRYWQPYMKTLDAERSLDNDNTA